MLNRLLYEFYKSPNNSKQIALGIDGRRLLLAHSELMGPLSAAQVFVEPVEGEPGRYKARFELRPHYQLDAMSVSLSIKTDLQQSN